MHKYTRYAGLRRPGFTLIELLAVIAIIGILAAMATWAVFAMVGGQQRRNTEATIKVVNKILQTHWQAVIDEADADAASGNISSAALALAGGDAARAKVIWRKCRLVEAFPETYAEVNTPWVYNYITAPQPQRYNDYYQKKLGGVLAANNPLTESGACLRLALSVARSGGANALTDDMIKYAIADTDNDNVLELIDSFDNPKQALAFFRFAWNFNNPLPGALVSMQGNATPGWTNLNPGFGKKSRLAQFPDPLDPDGTLLNPTWYNTANRLTFEMWFHPVTNPFPSVGGGATGCYVMPVIVSAGPGLDPATNTRPFGFNTNPAYPAKGYFSAAPATAGKAMQPDMSVDAQFLLPAKSPWLLDNIYSFQLTGN